MKRKLKFRKDGIIVLILIAATFLTIAVVLKDKLLRTLLSPQVVFAIAMPPTLGMQTTVPAMADAGDSGEHETSSVVPENSDDELQLEPDVPDSIRIELLDKDGEKIDLSGEEPRVLVYHTHTTEAYTMTPGNEYVETSKWRTAQSAKSIVAVGELLTSELRKKGIAVIHDVTNHEPPKLSSAYSRSLVTMERLKQQYPSINLFIDVHRDAAGSQTVNDYVTINGKHCARLMFVVGTGEGKTGAGFDIKPDFKANYGLAKNISESLLKIDKKLMRPIRVKTGRYNQHLAGRSLLVEVGHNENTLEEALNSIPYLADAIAKAAK